METQLEKKRRGTHEQRRSIDYEAAFFIGRSWQPGLPGPMIVLSWNCRGLSNPSAIPNMKGLAQGHKPDIIFFV
jgi:hypothetical protein